ncbi:MAG: hypothetical protein KDD60_06650 [Bdellovibrionales bacterium]|nr:hypothetical protein [Bdellovibrionales bacterium]
MFSNLRMSGITFSSAVRAALSIPSDELTGRFNPGLEHLEIRPIDSFAGVSRHRNGPIVLPEQAVEFVDGMYRFSQSILDREPSILFVPERGAGPLLWAIQETQRQQNAPLFWVCSLPVGTLTNPEDGKRAGMSKSRQFEIVSHTVQSHVADWRRAGALDRMVFVDEAQGGTTSIRLARYVQKALTSQGLDKLELVIAQDSRAVPNYSPNLKAKDISLERIEFPFITCDKPSVLNNLVLPVGSNTIEVVVVPNIEGQKLITMLMRARQNPELIEFALTGQECSTGLANMEDLEREVVTWIQSITTSECHRRERWSDISLVKQWFEEFSQFAKKR